MPTVPTLSIASEAAPEVGQYWPGQGGLYAGIVPVSDGQHSRHLIVSIDEVDGVAWGGSNASETDARSLHDGSTNTWALMVCGHEHPAAQWAADYTKDGHADFHLPSRRELQVAAATMRDQFAPQWYWSSSEHGWATALGHSFGEDDAPRIVESKNVLGRARAVRTIPVSD
ncbi:MAG: hypothetical protein QOH33_417 [Paraburkholderia sp.]|nr:hypothetical protein [Paraburkholderia sp.]